MRLAIATYHSVSYGDFASLTTRNHAEYCARHGYDYFDGTEKISDRPPSWNKIPMLRHILPEYDWVMWLDSDAMVMNLNVEAERIAAGDAALLLTRDPVELNCGVMLARNCPEAERLLSAIWDREEFINNGWWEQAALIDLYKSEQWVRDVVGTIDQRAMNSYMENFEPGDFILHLAGKTTEERNRVFGGIIRAGDPFKIIR